MNGLVSEVRKLGVCSRHLMQPGNEASSLLVPGCEWCWWGEPGIFSHVSNVKGRKGVERF